MPLGFLIIDHRASSASMLEISARYSAVSKLSHVDDAISDPHASVLALEDCWKASVVEAFACGNLFVKYPDVTS